MGQAIPRQHPAVVLRSHYRQLKMLLTITMIAVVGLSVAVAILATDNESSTGTTAVSERSSVQQSVRPEETGVAAAIAQTPDVARPDESKVAASISRIQQVQTPSQLQTPSQHDESDVAAAISGK